MYMYTIESSVHVQEAVSSFSWELNLVNNDGLRIEDSLLSMCIGVLAATFCSVPTILFGHHFNFIQCTIFSYSNLFIPWCIERSPTYTCKHHNHKHPP